MSGTRITGAAGWQPTFHNSNTSGLSPAVTPGCAEWQATNETLRMSPEFPEAVPQEITRLLALPGVTDLLLNGHEHSFIDAGRGLERCPNPFDSEQALRAATVQLALAANSRLDNAMPAGDFAVGRLRVHGVLPVGIAAATTLSIRQHPAERVLLQHLLEVNLMTPSQLELISKIIANGDNFLITGATGAGKTTLLSALINEMPGRTICIEEVAELNPPQPGITLTTRRANIEGFGELNTQILLREALRMRPDRVVVGEARGAELLHLLQAMNNGHRGSAATVHASSLDAVPDRLIMLGMLSGASKDLTARLVAGSIDWVVQLGRVDGARRILGIGQTELVAGELQMREVEPEAGLRVVA